MHNAKDISEKHLFDWPDVFADIWNFIAFDGKSVIQPIDLLGTKARTQLKVDGKLHEQERKTVSMVNYHLVFCPRYRRKIFLMDGLEARFKERVFAEIGGFLFGKGWSENIHCAKKGGFLLKATFLCVILIS